MNNNEINSNIYHQQANLLMEILPEVFIDPDFALRGGTAINFFYRDMPRYSVDIDLTYIKNSPRKETLQAINDSFKKMALRIKNHLPLSIITEHKDSNSRLITKLYVNNNNVGIKIETSTTIRGTIYDCEERPLCSKAIKTFNKYVVVKTLSFGEIYGSKICAALDRQHPRDIFDTMLLLKNEGLTDQVKKGFIVHLISHSRPMSELLSPNLSDMKPAFDNEFAGMVIDCNYKELLEYRKKIIKEVNWSMVKGHRLSGHWSLVNSHWALVI